jgi:Domain of unknown function (DUF1707)
MDDSLRAADRDRDQVAEALREHYAQGRLTMEEFDERTTAATSAKTLGELRTLTADLPVLAHHGEPERQRAWSPKQMRWIAVGGVAAAVVVMVLLTIFGHRVLAVPSWLFILIVVRLLHVRRRGPGVRGPRAGRG